MKVDAPGPRLGRRAYTLIELLIVVGLLGLAATLLVPHLIGGDSMKVQAAVRQLIGDLSFAQSDALANQEFRRVHFYDDGSGFCIIRVDRTNYATDWATWDPADIEYVRDPLSGGAEDGRYIVDFTVDSRFEGVSIVSADIDDDGGNDPEGDLIFDELGGTIRMVDGNPGTGGRIVVAAGADVYNVDISPFTGKLTVSVGP